MEMIPVVAKLANLGSAEKVTESVEGNGISFMVGTVEIFIPLDGLVDAGEEIAKMESELSRLRGFLEGVRKKLSNEAFISRAPAAIIENERKKEADSLSKIESYKSQLNALKNS